MSRHTMHSLRSFRSLGSLALAALFGSLASVAGGQTESTTQGSSPLAATLAAHGGLDRFKQQGQMTYRMNGFPLSPQMAKPNRSTVDLRTRRNRIDGEGFTVGFDGERAWTVPGPDAVGLPPRFVTLGSFYFIGMPFVFGDDGIVIEEAGTGTFDGETYRVVHVSYSRGTGYTSKDDYQVFIDPATDRLALINHSVTENPDVDRVTWTFDSWQEVDGLVVPARMTFYAGWNPESPGEGASFTIDEVRFDRRTPDRALYLAPTEAVIDDSPAGH